MNTTERNRCLDSLKGIACIGVVFIHVRFPGEIGNFIWMLARFAVPVFFMISGYYAYGMNIEKNHIKIIRRIKKIIFIFICAAIPYIIYTYYNPVYLDIDYIQIIRIIFLSDLSFINAGILWFLPSLIFGYLFFIFLNKFNLYNKFYILVPVLFMIRLIIQLHTEDVCCINNFALTAIPYMMIGHYIASHEDKIKKILSNKKLVIYIFISLFFVGIRRFLKVDITYLGIIMYSVSLFLLAVRNPKTVLSPKLEMIGMKYSLYVYVLHQLIDYIIDGYINAWLKPIIVLVVTLLVSFIFEKFLFAIKQMN